MKHEHILEYIALRDNETPCSRILSKDDLWKMLAFTEEKKEEIAYAYVLFRTGEPFNLISLPKADYLEEVLTLEGINIFQFFELCKRERDHMKTKEKRDKEMSVAKERQEELTNLGIKARIKMAKPY
jgi:hypothetical protein